MSVKLSVSVRAVRRAEFVSLAVSMLLLACPAFVARGGVASCTQRPYRLVGW